MTELSALGSVISALALENPTLGGDLDGGDKTISEFRSEYNTQIGTSYELTQADSGKVIVTTNGSAVGITLPNILSQGFVCSVIQKGAGQVTFTAASGATILNYNTHTKTAGQYAVVALSVILNSDDESAEYILTGNTGA